MQDIPRALAFRRKKSLLVGVFLVMGSVFGPAQTAAPVSMNLEKATITQGEPVLIDVHVENHRWPVLDVDLGNNGKGNLLIAVKTPDGQETRKPEPSFRTGGGGFFGTVHLQPDEIYSEALVLNEWFRFDQIGTYDIQIGLKTPAHAGGTVLPITTSTLRLQVTTKDPAQLTATCENLAGRVRNRQTAQDALAAALALSYVEDAVAVPYLEHVLTDSPGFEQFAVSGFVRIGDEGAVTALIRALHAPDDLRRSSARAALQSIAGTTSDATVRARIGDALKQ